MRCGLASERGCGCPALQLKQIRAADVTAAAARLGKEARRLAPVRLHASPVRVQRAKVGATQRGAVLAGLKIQALRVTEVDRDTQALLMDHTFVAAAFRETFATRPLKRGSRLFKILGYAT